MSLMEADVIFSSHVLALAVKHEHSSKLCAERLCMGSYLQNSLNKFIVPTKSKSKAVVYKLLFLYKMET